MLGVNFFFGAVFTGVLTALGIGYVSQNSRIKNDSAIGIVFTAFFAVGIILITLVKSSSDLYHILFGNVLAVRSSDMWITLVIGILILTAVFLFYKELLITSFDPTMAAVYGLPNLADPLLFNDAFDNGDGRIASNRRHHPRRRDADHACRHRILIDGPSCG
ncbi:metal ABC transporter permease [Bacillus sonorensis]|nr:metal ABC transporter permease [Bacillus sonorensis]